MPCIIKTRSELSFEIRIELVCIWLEIISCNIEKTGLIYVLNSRIFITAN